MTSDYDIIKAVENGDIETVKMILDGDMYAKYIIDDNGLTALIWASMKGHYEIVRLLIKYDADVNYVDDNGHTALLWACRNAFIEIVKLLIKHGADVNIINIRYNKSIALNMQIDILELLIKNGADLNHSDNYGSTILTTASCYKLTKVIKLLLENGADVNHSNNGGNTALILASRSRSNNTKTVKLLLENGADVDHINNIGETALMAASNNDRTETIKLLKSCDKRYTLSLLEDICARVLLLKSCKLSNLYLLVDIAYKILKLEHACYIENSKWSVSYYEICKMMGIDSST